MRWSDEDACLIGSGPELVYGGCHGADAKPVLSELCEIVEDSVELYEREGRPLPEPMSDRGFVDALPRTA